MAMLAILILPLSILGFTALAVVLPVGTGAMANGMNASAVNGLIGFLGERFPCPRHR